MDTPLTPANREEYGGFAAGEMAERIEAGEESIRRSGTLAAEEVWVELERRQRRDERGGSEFWQAAGELSGSWGTGGYK